MLVIYAHMVGPCCYDIYGIYKIFSPLNTSDNSPSSASFYVNITIHSYRIACVGTSRRFIKVSSHHSSWNIIRIVIKISTITIRITS